MKELIKKLNEAANLYYNYGTSLLTDKEYDILFQQLQEEEKRTGIIYSNSPTQKVGAPVLNEQLKITIVDKPMLSLEKVHSQEEINNFANGQEIVGMVKCDGLSVRIIYEGGKIISANTRGDGFVGQDISEHIKHFQNVPLTIPYNKRFVIDGEAVILDQDFKQLQGFANSRNAAAGTLGLLNMQEVEKRKLSFIAWDIIEGKNELHYLTQLLAFAEKLGFQVCPYSLKASNEEIKNEAIKRGIPQDGVVWRYNDLIYGESLGRTSHHWNYACAYKFPDEMTYTTLEDIEYTIGRTGILTPVAIFKPVDIEGAEISRASLHNLTILRQALGDTPHYGQKIGVFRANMINPQIGDADKSEYDIQAFLFDIPNRCPICGGEVIVKKDNESEFLMCDNPQCSGKLINIIDHYCSKKGLEIKGLSKATLEKLVEWGWIDNITDLYMLKNHREEWIKKAGFGVKSVDKILDAIESSKNCTLEAFIAALGIPLIGRAVAKELCNHIFSYEDLREKIDSGFDFTSIHGFGEAMHNAIVNFNYDNADKIIPLLTITTSVQSIPQAKEAINVTVCITGKLINYKSRDLLKSEIEARGGKVTSSVTAKTDYLIANKEEDTNKYNTALKLDIPIITEVDFINQFLDK